MGAAGMMRKNKGSFCEKKFRQGVERSVKETLPQWLQSVL